MSKSSKRKEKGSIVIKWVISISIIISIFNLILYNSFISKFDNANDGTSSSIISSLPKSRQKLSNALRVHNQNSNKEANLSKDKNDKRRVIEILESSGIIVDEMLFQRLPTWHQVKSLYYPNKNDQPIIHGTETCHHFQQNVSPKDRFIAPSGLFNSGTNLLHSLLTQYCIIPGHDSKNISTTQAAPDSSNGQEGFQSGILDKPPWNKHVPHEIRTSQMLKMPIIDGIEQSHVLPIYITKDPWYWMQSMCRHPYDARGFNTPSDPCPTLIQNQKGYLKATQTPQKINVVFPNGKAFKNIVFDSLIDLWIKWHEEYYQDRTIPQLFIRYEDLLFFPEQVLTTVCECGGGKIINDENGISLMEESVKLGVHAPPYTGLREAISIYRSAVEKDDENDPRLQGLHDDEVHFVKSKLQKSLLMQRFGYVSPQ